MKLVVPVYKGPIPGSHAARRVLAALTPQLAPFVFLQHIVQSTLGNNYPEFSVIFRKNGLRSISLQVLNAGK